MADRRTLVSPISELFSPDQRTGGGTRIHRARRIRKLKVFRARLFRPEISIRLPAW